MIILSLASGKIRHACFRGSRFKVWVDAPDGTVCLDARDGRGHPSKPFPHRRYSGLAPESPLVYGSMLPVMQGSSYFHAYSHSVAGQFGRSSKIVPDTSDYLMPKRRAWKLVLGLRLRSGQTLFSIADNDEIGQSISEAAFHGVRSMRGAEGPTIKAWRDFFPKGAARLKLKCDCPAAVAIPLHPRLTLA